jgi:polysaccharide export outer membrane protein
LDRTGFLDSHMSLSTGVRACTFALALFGLGCACADAAEPTQAAQQPAPAKQPTFASPYDKDALSSEYRIGTGDTLQVFVWREPELSRETRVRTDGFLTVALLGDVFAVAKTPRELAAELAEQLGRFVNAPSVTVTVVYSASQRFFIVGEVGRPGDFELIGRTTILQALALAGGFREYAKTEEIRIIRQEVVIGSNRLPKTREIVLAVNFKELARGRNLHQNFVMKPGDVVVVP